MSKSSLVRVKRKGQVTIPVEVREALGIQEGSVLEVRVDGKGIVMKAGPPLEAGKVVGKEEYEKVIRDLDEQRGSWR
ncbi:MAG: AbrB/MazE/SpoVT family DNA-binding domain-containing protein [Nitrososphaerota archaeon]|nr:AbrB/MazE/SpoVT family DNA-binding domain-containing protein [Nitrososphaerota archaeon]